MFGSKKTAIFSQDQVETIIGKDTSIKGTINSKGAVRIDGQFEGEFNITGNLVLGEHGKMTAQVKATNATISGTINGNVDIIEKLELMPTARVYGDIKVGVLIVGEGAAYKGACEMRNDSSNVKPALAKS